jgi:hypothetical protein
MKPLLALAMAIPIAACASTANGPSRLTGQELDAATALYGPWAEQVELKGRQVYIWRRSLIARGGRHFCELRVELGFRQTIRTASMQGLPDACALFAVRTEALTN